MTLFLAADLLSPNFGLIFWIGLVFLVLLFILSKYAWGPITTALQEREETIETSIKRAETALAEAKQLQADNEKARREAEAEAQRILREAREAADAARSEQVDKTRAQIRQMQEQAQAEIEREKQQALAELRTEVADLAIQAAEKILHENLDGQRQRRLVQDFITDLPKN
ncbi:MAG: F0F1 ATP synthase subunit B [Rhodothermales bacterium]|nr:F0F1 ATP synthase subunit B [Rhodothermales bacterium]